MTTNKDAPKKNPTRQVKATVPTSPAKPTKVAKTKPAKPSPEQKPAPKVAEPKLIRGRFTLPEADFDKIAALKRRARQLGRPAKKNELLRVGLSMLSSLSDEQLIVALDHLV